MAIAVLNQRNLEFLPHKIYIQSSKTQDVSLCTLWRLSSDGVDAGSRFTQNPEYSGVTPSILSTVRYSSTLFWLDLNNRVASPQHKSTPVLYYHTVSLVENVPLAGYQNVVLGSFWFQ